MEINRNYWKKARAGAKERGLAFRVTLKYAWAKFNRQKGRCVLSGVKLTFGYQGNASLDRIDSKKGYIPGNIQWVEKHVNRMKSNLSDYEIVYWAKKISKWNSGK